MFSRTVLKDKAQVVFPKISGLSLPQIFNMGFPHDNVAASGHVNGRQNIQQSGLSGAGSSHDSQKLALFNIK